MDSKVLRENRPTNHKMNKTEMIQRSLLHISIETFVQILFEHNPYAHVLSMNQVDNEPVQVPIVALIPDRKQRSRINIVLKKKTLYRITSSGINDRQTPSTTPKPVINVNICSTLSTSSS